MNTLIGGSEGIKYWTTVGEQDVWTFLFTCVNDLQLGLGFHPDTDFNDYVETGTDKAVFTKAEAKILNSHMKACFKRCKAEGLDIYALAMDVVKPLLHKLLDSVLDA